MEKLIAKDLLSIKAVFFRPEEPFTWASGIKSPVYCDNRLTLTAPKVRTDVEQGLAKLIKENFADREGGDVHRNDTLQETLSLSERFGLVVLFSKPNKQLYLEIVKTLAAKRGVVMDEKQLEIDAEAFALRKGNRSARCAEQFIESLL